MNTRLFNAPNVSIIMISWSSNCSCKLRMLFFGPSPMHLADFQMQITSFTLERQIFTNPSPGSQFFFCVQSRLIWRNLKRISEILRLNIGSVKICLVKKACVGEGGECERALDGAIGTGLMVWSYCEKWSQKTLLKMLKFSDCCVSILKQIRPGCRKSLTSWKQKNLVMQDL